MVKMVIGDFDEEGGLKSENSFIESYLAWSNFGHGAWEIQSTAVGKRKHFFLNHFSILSPNYVILRHFKKKYFKQFSKNPFWQFCPWRRPQIVFGHNVKLFRAKYPCG